MFSRRIIANTELRLSIPQFSRELFALTDKNRLFLRKWLPWLDRVKEEKDSNEFLLRELKKFSNGESLHACIFHEEKLAGVVGYNTLDLQSGIGTIGYWLGEEFNGQGIMTASVKDLIEIGRKFYDLQRVEIRCATENERSRAIPERLGFAHEGTLRQAERVYERLYDHELYALIIKPRCEQDSGGNGGQAR